MVFSIFPYVQNILTSSWRKGLGKCRHRKHDSASLDLEVTNLAIMTDEPIICDFTSSQEKNMMKDGGGGGGKCPPAPRHCPTV